MHRAATPTRAVLASLVIALVAACATRKPPVRAAADAPAATSEEAADDEASAEDEEQGEETDRRVDADEGTPCPRNMVLIDEKYCIDKFEASLVEAQPDGAERPFPHYMPVDGHAVRAVSEPGVFPQGFISEVQAQDACSASAKRLCTHVEWKTACMGPTRTKFPYGEARRPGACHEAGRSAVAAVFGAKAMSSPIPGPAPKSSPPAKNDGRRAHIVKGRAASTVKARASATRQGRSRNAKPGAATARVRTSPSSVTGAAAPQAKLATKSVKASRPTIGKPSTRPASVEPSVWTRLNDPALGQVEGALAPTASHPDCLNAFGIFDMVGNLHEWVATDATAPHGTFAGGYYLDTSRNGDGCEYRTVAHAHEYHDYSTGFRCCADPR